MKKLVCVLLCFSLLLVCACSKQTTAEKTAETVLSLCNEERAKLGLSELGFDESLLTAAEIRADEITQEGCFNHVRPDGSGCFTVIKGEYSCVGENLAKGENDAAKTVKAWMESPAHKANIIKPEFTKAAVAVVKSGDEYYFAMLFMG